MIKRMWGKENSRKQNTWIKVYRKRERGRRGKIWKSKKNDRNRRDQECRFNSIALLVRIVFLHFVFCLVQTRQLSSRYLKCFFATTQGRQEAKTFVHKNRWGIRRIFVEKTRPEMNDGKASKTFSSSIIRIVSATKTPIGMSHLWPCDRKSRTRISTKYTGKGELYPCPFQNQLSQHGKASNKCTWNIFSPCFVGSWSRDE